MDRGAWATKTVKRPRRQPAHAQYANYWAPLTRKRHIPPHPAEPRHTNDWALRTRKRHQQEHRPQRPTERSDPTQHAKGRTGDCPGPRKGATTRRNVTRGGTGKRVSTPTLGLHPTATPTDAQPPHPLSRNHATPANTDSLSSTNKGNRRWQRLRKQRLQEYPRLCLRYKRQEGSVRVAPAPAPPRPKVPHPVQLWRREQIKGHCESFRFDVGAKKSSAKNWVEGQNGIED